MKIFVEWRILVMSCRILLLEYLVFNLKSWILNNRTLKDDDRGVGKIMVWKFPQHFSSIRIEFRFVTVAQLGISFIRTRQTGLGYVWKSEASLKYYRYRSSLDPWFEQLILKLIKKVSNSIEIAVASADQSSDRRILLKDKHQSYRFRHFQDISDEIETPTDLIRF